MGRVGERSTGVTVADKTFTRVPFELHPQSSFRTAALSALESVLRALPHDHYTQVASALLAAVTRWVSSVWVSSPPSSSTADCAVPGY